MTQRIEELIGELTQRIASYNEQLKQLNEENLRLSDELIASKAALAECEQQNNALAVQLELKSIELTQLANEQEQHAAAQIVLKKEELAVLVKEVEDCISILKQKS